MILLGVEFHSLGVATWKALSPVVYFVGGTANWFLVDERSERLGLYSTKSSFM